MAKNQPKKAESSAEDDLSHEKPTWPLLHGPKVKEWDPTPIVDATAFEIRVKAIESLVVSVGPLALVFVGLIVVAAGLATAKDVVSILGILIGAGGAGAEVVQRRR